MPKPHKRSIIVYYKLTCVYLKIKESLKNTLLAQMHPTPHSTIMSVISNNHTSWLMRFFTRTKKNPGPAVASQVLLQGQQFPANLSMSLPNCRLKRFSSTTKTTIAHTKISKLC